MNPRAFCREGSYEMALLLTYSFDPLFFERVVLRDLWAGGMNECLVIADRRALDEALPRAIGQVHHLGRRYRLTTPSGDTMQHAKLILRAGPAGAVVWVGSGNLTCGGWGENSELATAWQIEPSDEQGVMLFSTLIAGITPILHGSAEQFGQKLLDLPWVSNKVRRIDSNYALLMSQKGATLASQLARRWEGRDFHTVRVLTGSTDHAGAFLDWAARTFGVKKAVIGLCPDCSDFEPKRLKKLPLEVRIVPLPASPMSHAKFYYFEGKKRDAAVVGSANCSAAAWLAPMFSSGNTELVVVYDRCDRDDFRKILKILDKGKEVPPESVLNPAKEEVSNDGLQVHGIHVLELSVSRSTRELKLGLAAHKATIRAVVAHFGELQSPLKAGDDEGTLFVGKYPDLPMMTGTYFARIVFELKDGYEHQVIRWLDEEDELAQSSVRHRILSIERLATPTKTSEQRQIIEGIADVARAIFSNREFPDPVFVSEKAEEEDKDRPAVDPHQLVRSIELIPERHSGMQHQGPGAGFSLHGIMRILFESTRRSSDENFDVDETGSVLDVDDEAELPKKTQREEPPESLKSRLVKTMEHFLEQETEAEFLTECTATQLSQATAFPLAVAARALDGGWIDESMAESWFVRVLNLLFNTQLEDDNGCLHAGALALVTHRYSKERRLSTLEKVFGDGLLWSALVLAFSHLQWDQAKRFLAKELYLRDLFDAPILYARADPETVSRTIQGYRGRGSAKELLSEAEKIARRVKTLEKCLSYEFEELCQRQKGLKHEIGDLVYRPKAGFGWTRENAPISSSSKLSIYLRRKGDEGKFCSNWYCNVRLAAAGSKAISKLLERLGAIR
ncbi:MAG: hypothetical protein IT365_01835 [Candidatus Hydrogenedentes bacterium]|nr:hypothetical protein [Candidatus Hydrogenedentota bacterium]